MSAPNCLAATTVIADTAIAIATTSVADLIAAVTTGHIKTLESILCSNYSDNVACWITVIHKKGGTEYHLAHKQRISARQSINVLLGKSLNLAEGDSVRIEAENPTNIVCLAPFSDATDL